MDFHEYIMRAHHAGQLVIQPRLGVPDPREMAARLGALARLTIPVVGTLTVDSYTRVGDLTGARNAWQKGSSLNGFPLAMHPPEVVRWVVSHADSMPLQVRHGSADPRIVLRAARANGITASEGGPVSYCLPYSRMPLSQAVEYWREAVQDYSQPLAGEERPHLETFGGCMLGQLCPPALLVALSILEARFFEQCGISSISLSYAEQGHWGQDVEALQALSALASGYLSPESAVHLVQYSYMGVYPGTQRGALALGAESARKARAGGAHRLIVKTVAEAHRLPTLSENLSALEHASAAAADAPVEPNRTAHDIAADARRIVDATLALHDDVGEALIRAFAIGILDVPYCLHPDNRGDARSTVAEDGRVLWSDTGAMPLSTSRRTQKLTSTQLLAALTRISSHFDAATSTHRVAFIGVGPRNLSIIERIATRMRTYASEMPPVEILVIEPYSPGSGRIWRTNQPRELLMNTVCQEVTMFSGPQISGRDEPGAGRSLAEWWEQEHPETYMGGNSYAPRSLYGEYLEHVYSVCLASLRENVSVTESRTSVDTMSKVNNIWELRLRDGNVLEAETVVCGTGHPRAASIDNPDYVGDPKNSLLHGDSAADIPIDHVGSEQKVGLIGMGLSFYDLMARFTIGRGGTFIRTSNQELSYISSGAEPRIYGMSRSGLPIPARGRNQKSASYEYVPHVFNQANLKSANLEDVIRLLEMEVQIAHSMHFIDDREIFRQSLRRLPRQASAEDVHLLALEMGAEHAKLPPLKEMARPFSGIAFEDQTAWNSEILQFIENDVINAEIGNISDPLKSALDVIRDVRSQLRGFLEEGALSAEERSVFDQEWAPVLSLLTAGPPVDRVRELGALIRAGVVTICPPGTSIEKQTSGFKLRANSVPEYGVDVDHVIDARIQKAVWPSDRPDLVSHLIGTGFMRLWHIMDESGSYSPGGVDVDRGQRAIDRAGRVDPSLLVVGIPTEGKRWFTQVGSGRPGAWSDFTMQADKTAEVVISRAFTVAHQRSSDPERIAEEVTR